MAHYLVVVERITRDYNADTGSSELTPLKLAEVEVTSKAEAREAKELLEAEYGHLRVNDPNTRHGGVSLKYRVEKR